LRSISAQPLKELALAGDRNPVGSGLRQAVRRPAVVEQRPAKLANHEHVGLSRDALARISASLTHQRKRVRPFHRCEPPREGNRAFEDGPIGFGVACQRPVFLLAAAAPARTLVLAAAGFFAVSAPMLARSASIRLITRCGGASSFSVSTIRPACLACSN